jgi:hypothetical protein
MEPIRGPRDIAQPAPVDTSSPTGESVKSEAKAPESASEQPAAMQEAFTTAAGDAALHSAMVRTSIQQALEPQHRANLAQQSDGHLQPKLEPQHRANLAQQSDGHLQPKLEPQHRANLAQQSDGHLQPKLEPQHRANLAQQSDGHLETVMTPTVQQLQQMGAGHLEHAGNLADSLRQLPGLHLTADHFEFNDQGHLVIKNPELIEAFRALIQPKSGD